MSAFINFGRMLLAKLIAALYTLLSVFGGGVAFKEATPVAPEDFTPVVRFAVCSDVHLSGEEDQEEARRFEKLFDVSYAYAESQPYNALDAVVVAGDMTNDGLPEQYRVFNGVADKKLREGTQFLVCTGNHEYIAYRDEDASVGAKVFREMMGHDTETSTVINGYHFILCSYCDDGKTFRDKMRWLDGEMKAAVADTGDKPIFVFQHPGPFATVYGSVNWGDASIPTVMLKYPQAVNFSGHSHYPVNDPRSIWQGGYTALGCGTLSYFETELDGIAGNFPYETEQAAQFYIVEADADGNVRIKLYDLITDQFFDTEYYLTDLAERNYEYSYLKMKLRDKAPVFPADTAVSTAVNENGETILTFTGAKDRYVVESYKVSVTRAGVPVAADNFSGKYMYLFEEDKYDVNLGKLESGKTYKAKIVAMNAYAETSAPFTYTFTAE